MKIDLVNGDTSVRVAGSGDFILGGTANFFKCRITGSSDVDASRLTANDAEIYIDGSGSVRIGRIINSSKEKISKGAELTVNRRG